MSINLLYHDVIEQGNDDASGFPGPSAARYKLTRQEFDTHLNQIAAVVKQPALARTSIDAISKPDHQAWMITFDDGGVSAVTEIAEQLERRGWRGWFFISTDFIGQPTFCSREQLRELHQRGHIIGSHSCSHPERISNCTSEELLDEWSRSCLILSDIIKEPIVSASVPGGFYSLEVARAARQAGIQVLFNSEPTTTPVQVDGLWILGRYNVYRGMSASDAASLIGSPLRRWRQSAFWNMKKVAKVLAGPVYKSIRQRILRDAYSNARPSQSAE